MRCCAILWRDPYAPWGTYGLPGMGNCLDVKVLCKPWLRVSLAKTRGGVTKSHGQTQKAHPNPTKSHGQTQKARTNPTKSPKPNTKAPPKPTKASRQPPRPKPHHLMKSERAARHCRVALSLFGGRGGTSSPPHSKKSLFRQIKAQHHRDDEDAGDGAVGKDSSDDWGEGVKNRGIDEGGSDAKAKRQCHDDHVAIAEPAVGDHVDSVVDD